ncbi:putative ABC transport system permease protein [Breznakibacter xylanolyticus]|uniref:Putative ABC transport system permease protein n=1 Tax=Breznakibacter xylanolyticus TaxID=990 RepID=A0A2W7NKA4_9BACT|nr:FtsX-like permease family protein [Breznakibacter xylanolyticus]PZX20290.1 putative ABC transport system permease protein [Breznakibacter xylanolyticus]
MIGFLLIGILRDKSRSLLPMLVVGVGAMLTVFLHCWLTGIMGDSIELSARFATGHLKVMTRPYAAEAEQMPNELAIIGVGQLMDELSQTAPDMQWVARIRFGALLDVPDSLGETRAQGPVTGWALDLLSPGSSEAQRLNLASALTSGHLPQQAGQALITHDFATRFAVMPGHRITLMGNTMNGSLAFANFEVAGTVRFGSSAVDRGGIFIDLRDAQMAFDMRDAAGEVLGFFPKGFYVDATAQAVQQAFEAQHNNDTDEYAPVMMRLSQQAGMADYLAYANTMGSIMVMVFVLAMSVVLWNAGLLGGLRRYREFGLRLALGESKGHIYRTLLAEAVLVGTLGSTVGTAVGLALAFWMQTVGIDLSEMMPNASLMMPSVARAAITPPAYGIGFIPGLLSMVLGNALSGIGIYKRETARLFNELEV